MNITEKQNLALRKNAMPTLRKLGITDIADYEPHKLDWGTINGHQKEIMKSSRSIIDKLGNDISEDELAELEAAHEAQMAIYDAIEREKDIRSEIGNRGARQTNMSPRNPNYGAPDVSFREGENGEFIGDDEPVEVFALRSKQTMVDHVLSQNRGEDHGSLSVGAFLRSMVTGPKNEVEKRALAEGTDSAGGFTVPDILSARMIDRLRAASVVFRAGAQTVPLTSDKNNIAKVASDPVPGWRNENAAVAESDPTFANVTLVPRSLMVMVRVSREVLEDSLNMETVLPDIIAKAMAAEVDRVALLGTGAAPQPRGVVNFAGLTANGFAGGALASYGPLIQARTALRTVDSDVTAFIMSPRDDGNFAGLTATDGQPLMVPPAIANTPMLVTSVVPTNGGTATNESRIIAGDWSKLLIGFRSKLQIEILKERYADLHQYAFVAHLRADVVAEHEKAFTVIGGITPTED